MARSKQQKLFSVWKWYSNKVGWVRVTFTLGLSRDNVLKANPSYRDKRLYLLIEE